MRHLCRAKADDQETDENPSASQQPENVNMEQVDYDPDSDDDDSDEKGHPLEGRPFSKAMPHPKLVPKSPPPTLRLVSKVKPAPKNTLDDETESDNHPGDRPALPRRPVMRPVLTSNDRWFVTYGSDTNISLQKESVHPGPFGNSKFLTFVHECYKECSTILDVNPDFHFVPEHERPHGVKVFWLKARFNNYWHPTLQGEGPHGEAIHGLHQEGLQHLLLHQCSIRSLLPMVCHNGNIDLDKTVQNVEQVCKYFRMEKSKAKQITDLILWRIERMSRSFSGCLRHDPRHGIHKECKRQVEMGPDGSVELYDALTCITHARNFIGNKPGLLLMAMFPSYGKSRIEIAFVFPSVDGTYNERKARGEIVPRNRWIDKLNTRSAQGALRPDGKDFYVDPEMELYVRCNSGHTRQVDIQSFGRPLFSEQKEPHCDGPDYDLPTESIPPSPHPSRSEAPHGGESTAQPKYRMRRLAPPSVEEERKIKPFSKKPITFMFHATYGSQLYSIMEHGLKSGKSQSNPSGRMHVHMACIDDVTLEDDQSETALTHVPAGRDALLILAFLKDQDYGIRLSEERTALTDKTI